MWPSCSTMPSGAIPRPVLPCDSGLRWVKMCMRVVLNQTNQGLPSCCFASMNLTVLASTSSSIVSIRFFVSGPVSSQRCLPHFPKRASSASVLAVSVA